MIEINLLPPEHRPVERTPVPRLLTILAGVLLATVGVVLWAFLRFVFIPNARIKFEEAKHNEAAKKLQRDEVERQQARLKIYSAREEVLRNLYSQRVRWTRVLDCLADARKSTPNVVITSIDMKRGAASGGARGKEPLRQLNLEGYVASFADDPVNADLVNACRGFVSALNVAPKWQTMFEPEPDIKSIEVIKFGAGGGGAKAGARDPRRVLPKTGLQFTVIFNFKSTAPAPPAKTAATGTPTRPQAPR